MIDGKRTTAIVLAAGSGKRMGSDTKKQYMQILEKPVVYYALKIFQDSFVDEIVMVVSKGDEEYCQKEIVERFQFTKVKRIVEGGKERYHSVYKGILACGDCDYIYIHDGARPCIYEDLLLRLHKAVVKHQAAILGMPVKDTIKVSDEQAMVAGTPERKYLWQIQTPQVFSYSIIFEAYQYLMKKEEEFKSEGVIVTDDAMVVETVLKRKIKLVEGDYKNIKITTPEDLAVAEIFLRQRDNKKI